MPLTLIWSNHYYLNLLYQAGGGRWKILRISGNFKLVLVATFGHRDLCTSGALIFTESLREANSFEWEFSYEVKSSTCTGRGTGTVPLYFITTLCSRRGTVPAPRPVIFDLPFEQWTHCSESVPVDIQIIFFQLLTSLSDNPIFT